MSTTNDQICNSPEMQKLSRKSNQSNEVLEWVIRLIKGIIVGIGAIVPGLSGGVLMVVFGLYQPLLNFLANVRYKFLKNVFFFLPVGIGGLLGVVGFSAAVDFAFNHYAAQFTWLFIGFISGTFPSLIKTSGKEGRKNWHWFLLAAITAITFFFMNWMKTIQNVTVTPNLFIWIMSGALTGLGLVMPGLSPSNFLIYLGLYQPMARGIRQFDFGVILPLILGVVIIVFVFAKMINWLFKKQYAFMYHFILGIVVGSTLAIIPGGVKGSALVICAILFVIGAVISYLLAIVDERHPHEALF